MFSEGSEIGTDDAERVGAVIGTESAGDFLFEFWHANGAFGEVVVEGDGGIGEEAQDIVAIALKAFEQIGSLGLFNRSAAAGEFGALGVERLADCDELDEALVIVVDPRLVQRLASSGLDFVLSRDEQVNHFLRPGLFGCLADPDQFAQVMGIAQGVTAGIIPIGRESIMNSRANKSRQNVEGLESLQSSLGMVRVPG